MRDISIFPEMIRDVGPAIRELQRQNSQVRLEGWGSQQFATPNVKRNFLL